MFKGSIAQINTEARSSRSKRSLVPSVPIVRKTSTFPEFRKRGSERRLPFAVTRRFFLDQESDLLFPRLRRGHQLADGIEDNFELRVVFSL